MAVLITNSNVKHQLTGSEYPERRAACLDSARAMDTCSLREVNMETVDSHRDKFDDVTYRRVRHVVTEIARYLNVMNNQNIISTTPQRILLQCNQLFVCSLAVIVAVSCLNCSF